MINMDDKFLKRLYIEQTLKNRKYVGFRLDIALIKLIITAISFAALYLYTSNLFFSVFAGAQIFLILTLFNKMTIDKKIKVGKNKLSQRIKKEKFKNKVFYSDYEELENFIMLYLNQHRYKNIQKVKEFCYSAVKNEEKIYICIVKFYEGSCIEKIDIRNLFTFLADNKVKKSIIVTINSLSEEAAQMLEKLDSKIEIELISFEDLYSFADKNLLLSEDYEYEDIEKLDKKLHKKTRDIVGNIFINRKIIMYLISAVIFYIMHIMIFKNKLGLYISYYFILLAVINSTYNLYKSFTRKKAENK